MKTIFNEDDKNEILNRIEKLSPQSKPIWGKMDVAQMLAHCALGAKFPTGEVRPTPSSLRFVGRFFKKKILEKGQFAKNSPTAKEIRIVDARDFEKEKMQFIAAIKKLYEGGEKGVAVDSHAFFGKMTPKEWGRLNYIHADHHLSQFGV